MNARLMIACGFGLTLLWAFSGLPAAASLTTDEILGDFNGDNRLELQWPGESHLLRADLCDPGECQDPRPRRSLLHFGHFTDAQIVDEESPARLEDIDDFDLGDDLLGGAYRPQESLGLQINNEAVRTINRIRSPLSQRQVQFVVNTGDNTDNIHQNEIEDHMKILNGGTVDPNSGRPPRFLECPLANPNQRPYQGVRAFDWYEPDRSVQAPRSEADGDGYSNDEGENFAEVGRHVSLRDFPGLFEEAQEPFSAEGLQMPWLTVFGNHDALWQGNVPEYFGLEGFARGCYKNLTDDFLLDEVQPDDERRLLDHEEWIAKHFEGPATPGPVGHGFDQSNPDQGFYSKKVPGLPLRLIGLDTVNIEGLSNGLVRDGREGHPDQFNWLVTELDRAKQANQRVIVFGHHTLRTINNTDIFGTTDHHCGLASGPSQTPGAISCTQLSQQGNESLEELFYRHSNVVAYIAGHEHVNYIEPRRETEGPGRFWEIATASEIDWPQQSSLIEIGLNRDGTLSIFRTLVDHSAPADPGDDPDLNDPTALASIGREISFNDHQGRTGEDGTVDARGEREDRNVQLIVPD